MEPEIYVSRYSIMQIENLAKEISSYINEHKTVWCIFDNTTLGAAYIMLWIDKCIK